MEAVTISKAKTELSRMMCGASGENAGEASFGFAQGRATPPLVPLAVQIPFSLLILAPAKAYVDPGCLFRYPLT